MAPFCVAAHGQRSDFIVPTTGIVSSVESSPDTLVVYLARELLPDIEWVKLAIGQLPETV
jgi:hypothetical protein